MLIPPTSAFSPSTVNSITSPAPPPAVPSTLLHSLRRGSLCRGFLSRVGSREINQFNSTLPDPGGYPSLRHSPVAFRFLGAVQSVDSISSPSAGARLHSTPSSAGKGSLCRVGSLDTNQSTQFDTHRTLVIIPPIPSTPAPFSPSDQENYLPSPSPSPALHSTLLPPPRRVTV